MKEEFDPAGHIATADHENALRQLFGRRGKVFGSYAELQSAVTKVYRRLLGQFNSGKATMGIRFYLDRGMIVLDAGRKYKFNPAYRFADKPPIRYGVNRLRCHSRMSLHRLETLLKFTTRKGLPA